MSSIRDPSTSTPSHSEATSNNEANTEIGRAEQQELEITTRDDTILMQANAVAAVTDSLDTLLRPSVDKLACRRIRLHALNVPLNVNVNTVLYTFDPFVKYFNDTLTKNSSLSSFRDVYFDLKITVTVISLPAYAGFLRFFFSRFHSQHAEENTRMAYEHYDLDVSNKEYLEFTLTMELPYRVMNTIHATFSSHGVGNLVVYAPLQITAPQAAGSNIRVEIYGEPINLRVYNLIPRFLTPRLQTALQPMEVGTVSDITMREPVQNTMAPIEIASRWGYAGRYTLPSILPTSALIMNLPLVPTHFHHTPLCEVANVYSFWRGSIKFRLTINLNKFQNVQLAVSFLPKSATLSDSAYDACAFQDFVFDQTHVHEFEVEYSAGSQWLPTKVSSFNNSEGFGSMHVYMRSPVISVVPPANQAAILVEVAAGNTFEVAHPRDHIVPLPQPAVVQTLNSEFPIRSISASTNLYSDAALPALAGYFNTFTKNRIVHVTPLLAQTGVLSLLRRSHAAWNGALEFIVEFLEDHGALEIRYDPIVRSNAVFQFSETDAAPTAGYTLFANASVNRIFRFKVPFVSIYDYVVSTISDYTAALDLGSETGALFFQGKAQFKLYVKATDDFKVLFYNSFQGWTKNADPFDAVATHALQPISDKSTWHHAKPESGWADKLGIDSSGINETISEVRDLVSSLRPLVHLGTNIMDTVMSLLEGPGKIFAAAFNVATMGLEGLKTIVLNLHTFISTFLEVVTPSYIWSFLKSSVAESFTSTELLVLYGTVVVAGACALDITNPSFIVLALVTFGLATPSLINITTQISETLLSEVAAPAVKASLRVEASSTSTCVVTILTTLIGLLIPTSKGTALPKLGSFAKDFSAIFSGAKAMDEIVSSLVSVIISSPVISSALGCDFPGVSLLLSVNIEGFVDEIRNLMLDDFYNKGITSEMIVNQERLTKIRREIEAKLPKVDKTNFFFNTTLRKVMDEQEKMHKHVKAHRGHARERFSPFCMMIHGETRVGKSVLAASLQEQFCELMDWDIENDVYTRQNNDKYFSGLGHQKILYIDDAHTNINADGADSDMATIMSFATNAPWAPPMATLEDKGRCVTSLIGMFVTNTPGVPTYAGIRNPQAYLARRNLLIKMRWKEGQTVHSPDFAHAEFVLNDPFDPDGIMCLDKDGNAVRENDPNVLVLTYSELWQLCAKRFVEHMVKQRKLRSERRTGNGIPAPIDDELLTAVRKMCDNFDDLDAVPLTQFLPSARTEASTVGDILGATLPRYEAIYELFADKIESAVNDIFYLPSLDTFVWRGLREENRELYFSLLSVSTGERQVDHFEFIEELASVIASVEDPNERSDMYLAIAPEFLPHVYRRVDRILKIRATMDEFATIGSKSFWTELSNFTIAIPRWVKMLLLAGTTGGFIYYMLRSKNPITRLSAPPVVVPPQYEKTAFASMAMPVKKVVYQTVDSSPGTPPQSESSELPVSYPPQYAKDPIASLQMPLKKKAPLPVQYEKVPMPSFQLPVKKTVLTPFDPAPKVLPLENPAPLARPQSAAELEEAQKQISDKVCSVWRSGAIQNGYLLDDRHVLVNRHFVCCAYPPLVVDECYQFKYEVSGSEVTQCFLEERVINVENLWPVGHEDFVIIKLPVPLPGVKKGWGHLVTERELTALYPTTGILITRSPKFKSIIHSLYPVKRMLRSAKDTFINLDGAMNVFNPSSIFVDGFTYRAVTSDGSCGGPLILEGTGGKICGLHGAGFVTPDRSGECLAHLLYKEMIEEALQERGKLFYWSDNPNYAEPAPVYSGRLDALNALFVRTQACIDVEKFGLEVVGTTDMSMATRGSMKTSFVESPISRFFPFEPFRVPAVLTPHDNRVPYPYDPRPDILGKYTRPIKPLNHTRLMRVVDHLATQLSSLYHPYKPQGLLTFTQSVDGVPGAPFYDSINMHSSPGIPYSFHGHHRKASMFTIEGEYVNGSPHYLPVTPILEARYDSIITAAMEGKMVEVLFQEFMKDELVKRAKVFDKPATRGIANPPIDLLLAIRSAFLPFIALCMYNRSEIDCQVGINPMSGLEWTAIVNRLQGNSDLVFDADYSAFDSTIHGETLDAFAQLTNKVMGGSYAEQLARKVLVRYTYDRVSQVTNVQVKIDQGMASGMPITAVGNSIVNMFYLRYAWLKLAETHAPELATLRLFDENVKAIVYGDDNMVTVKPLCAQWYNLRTIAASLSEYGIVMTDGKKNSGDLVQPFGEWDQMRFLKRAFVLDPRTGMYLAPLEMKTILDRIRYVKSKTWVVDLDMRCQASLMDAVLHGKEVFTALQFFINDCYKELDLVPYTFEYEFERGRWESAGRLAENQMLRYTTMDQRTSKIVTYRAPQDRPPSYNGSSHVLVLNGPDYSAIKAQKLNVWLTDLSENSGGSGSSSTSQDDLKAITEMKKLVEKTYVVTMDVKSKYLDTYPGWKVHMKHTLDEIASTHKDSSAVLDIVKSMQKAGGAHASSSSSGATKPKRSETEVKTMADIELMELHKRPDIPVDDHMMLDYVDSKFNGDKFTAFFGLSIYNQFIWSIDIYGKKLCGQSTPFSAKVTGKNLWFWWDMASGHRPCSCITESVCSVKKEANSTLINITVESYPPLGVHALVIIGLHD
jgi:hypothetical protein